MFKVKIFNGGGQVFKKSITIIILGLLLTGCGITAKEVEPQFLPSELEFEELYSVMLNPVAIHTIASDEIRYVADPKDGSGEYRTPRQTWELRYGDCEDYAIFCAYFLHLRGYNYTLMNVYNETSGHAVCIWEVENGYKFSSNGCIRQIVYPDTESIAKAAMPSYTSYWLYKIEDVNK